MSGRGEYCTAVARVYKPLSVELSGDTYVDRGKTSGFQTIAKIPFMVARQPPDVQGSGVHVHNDVMVTEVTIHATVEVD